MMSLSNYSMSVSFINSSSAVTALNALSALNVLRLDRNLINWSIICSNDSYSGISDECLHWFTSSWDSEQQTPLMTQISSDSSDATAINDISSTIDYKANAFDELLGINETIISSDSSEQLASLPSYKWPFLLLGILVFTGGFGNILVCLAIGFERRLQNATNYFLLSLAVADLLVSIVVMPFGILNEFFGIWPFGTTICNLWVTCDVLCCSSSILHMCFISVGRYIGIKNPLHARQAPLLVSRRAVLLKIAFAWLLSAIITSPITILAIVDQSNIQPEQLVCAISNRPFLILGSLSAFFLPMIVMVNSYVLTVRLLRRKAKLYQDCHSYSTSSGKDSSDLNSTNKNPSASGKDHYCANRTTSSSSSSSAASTTSGKLYTQCTTSLQRNLNCSASRSSTLSQHHLAPNRWEPESPKIDTNHCKKKSNRHKTQPLMLRTLGSSLQVRNEQKATKVLGLVFFAFVICWAPFFVLNVTFGILPRNQSSQLIPDEVTTTFLWLGYVSSIINPIIYTIFNRNFRRAFRRIILCQICGHESVSNRRFSRTASQKDTIPALASAVATASNTTHTHRHTHTHHTHTKKMSSSHSHSHSHSHSPTHQIQISSANLYDISSSYNCSQVSSDSNNHQCHNFSHYYNKPLSWKFKSSAQSKNNNGSAQQQHECNKECSL